MTRFIKNNWKWVLTTIISIAAVVPAWLALNTNNKKSLSYEVQSVSPLVSDEQISNNGVKVLFNGKEVTKPFVSVIRIINNGGIPIEKKDFDNPVTIAGGKAVRVLSASIIDKQPNSIATTIEQSDNKAILLPTLLNPEDTITIKLITGDEKPEISIYGRITGVKDLTKYGSGHKQESLILSAFSLGAILFGIVYAILTNAYSERDKDARICFIPSNSLFIIGIPYFLVGIPITFYFIKKFNLSEGWGFLIVWMVIVFSGEIISRLLKLNTGSNLKVCRSE